MTLGFVKFPGCICSCVALDLSSVAKEVEDVQMWFVAMVILHNARNKHHPERSIVSSKHVWPGIFSFFLVLESSPIEVHRWSGAVVLSNVFFTSIRCPLFLVSRHFMSIPPLKTHTIFCSAVKTHLAQPTSALLACSGRVSWWWNYFFFGGSSW